MGPSIQQQKEMESAYANTVSYTHLTLPTNHPV